MNSLDGIASPKEVKTSTEMTLNEEPIELFRHIRSLCAELYAEGYENKKFMKLEDHLQLLHTLDHVIRQLTSQYDKIQRSLQISPIIESELRSILTVLLEIRIFYEEVSKSTIFTSKKKLRARTIFLQQTLRIRCTQLLTAVSLTLFTPEEPKQSIYGENYTLGLHYYYGISGKPRNYSNAFEKFSYSADNNEEEGMVMISRCYLLGHGVEKDLNRSYEYLERASKCIPGLDGKVAQCQFLLEQFKLQNSNVIKDYFIFLQSGHLLDENSHEMMTDSYHDHMRDSVRSSLRQSISNKILSSSMVLRGNIDDNGTENDEYYDDPVIGDPRQRESINAHNEKFFDLPYDTPKYQGKDIQYVFRLLLEVAQQGHAGAKTILGSLFEEGEEIQQAAKWYSLASNSGCSQGTYRLGNLMIHSRSGHFMESRHKAFSLFMMAARNGESKAWNGLGLCYESGIGTEVDVSHAIQAYRNGARENCADAMYNLGYTLVKRAIEVHDSYKRFLKEQPKTDSIDSMNGHVLEGFTPSLSVYYSDYGMHYSLASLATYPKNINKDNIDSQGPPPDVLSSLQQASESLQEGIHWLRAAAENRIADAAFQLGRLYEQAIGVPLDPAAAFANYKMAAHLNHTKGAYFAGNLLYKFYQSRQDSGAYGESRHIDLRILEDTSEYYLQAARGGMPEAMNAFALLLEDHRRIGLGLRPTASHPSLSNNSSLANLASEEQMMMEFTEERRRSVELAAGWYYQACLHKFAPAYLNLALLLASEPIESFPSLDGRTVLSCSQVVEFLQENSPYSTMEERVDQLNSLLDTINRRNYKTKDDNKSSIISSNNHARFRYSDASPMRTPEGNSQDISRFSITYGERKTPLKPPRPSQSVDLTPTLTLPSEVESNTLKTNGFGIPPPAYVPRLESMSSPSLATKPSPPRLVNIANQRTAIPTPGMSSSNAHFGYAQQPRMHHPQHVAQTSGLMDGAGLRMSGINPLVQSRDDITSFRSNSPYRR